MDTSIMLVGLVLLAVAIGPIIAILINQRMQDKKLEKQLEKVGVGQGAKFNRKELYKARAFGLDEEKGLFVFLHQSKKGLRCETVNLSEVKECRFSKQSSTGTDDEVSDLLFTFADPKTKPQQVSFYNPEMDNFLNHDGIQRITIQWAEYINTYLKLRTLAPVVKLEANLGIYGKAG